MRSGVRGVEERGGRLLKLEMTRPGGAQDLMLAKMGVDGVAQVPRVSSFLRFNSTQHTHVRMAHVGGDMSLFHHLTSFMINVQLNVL